LIPSTALLPRVLSYFAPREGKYKLSFLLYRLAFFPECSAAGKLLLRIGLQGLMFAKTEHVSEVSISYLIFFHVLNYPHHSESRFQHFFLPKDFKLCCVKSF